MELLTSRLVVAVLAGISSLCACAAEPVDENDIENTPEKANLLISLGAYYPALDTRVSLGPDSSINATARVDFESDLGMRDVALMPILRMSYRFNARHRINLDYFDLKRSGSETSKVTITFGNRDFAANLPLTSFFDVETFSLSYGYSVYSSETVDFALSAGLSVQDISFGLATTGELEEVREESDVTLPLPTLGLSGTYALSPKWLIDGRIGYFAVELNWEDSDRDLGGQILDASVMLNYRMFKNFGVGIGWSHFDVDVDYRKRRLAAKVDYTYSGPILNAYAYF